MTIAAPSKFFNKKYDEQYDSKPKCNGDAILEIPMMPSDFRNWENWYISLNFELFIPLLKIYEQRIFRSQMLEMGLK